MSIHKFHLPGAPAFALLVLLAVEAFVRAIGPGNYIAFERGMEGRPAIRRLVMASGSSEVLIVGSSRSEEGFDCPQLHDSLTESLGREVEVANYAQGGAQASETIPMVHYILRHPPLPRLIVYGVSPEQIGMNDLKFDQSTGVWLKETVPVNERSAMFWGWNDFFTARKEFGPRVDPFFPVMVRNEIEEKYVTLRARGKIMNAVRNRLRGRLGSPIIGESLDPAGRSASMADEGFDHDEIATHVKEVHLTDGRYPFNQEKLALFRNLVRDCQGAGVPLVFIELPSSNDYEMAFPRDTLVNFREEFEEFSLEVGVDFFTLPDLGLRGHFQDVDFRDAMHLNLKGSERFTDAVAEAIDRGASQGHWLLGGKRD